MGKPTVHGASKDTKGDTAAAEMGGDGEAVGARADDGYFYHGGVTAPYLNGLDATELAAYCADRTRNSMCQALEKQLECRYLSIKAFRISALEAEQGSGGELVVPLGQPFTHRGEPARPSARAERSTLGPRLRYWSYCLAYETMPAGRSTDVFKAFRAILDP